MAKKHKTTKPASSGLILHQQRRAHKQNLTWLWVGLGVIIIAGATFLLLQPKASSPSEISAAQAYQKYQQGAFILDVRDQAEWDQGHIAKSTLIPLDELQNRLSELPKDRDIVVVCHSGVRSKEGMTILLQAGFSRTACMTGGLIAWQAAGYPLEGSAP
jgi:rhodanese-related sulfurtransferase